MALYRLRGDRFELVRTALLRADFLRVKQGCDLAPPPDARVGCRGSCGANLLRRDIFKSTLARSCSAACSALSRLTVAACGSSDDDERAAAAAARGSRVTRLTIYSSLPLQGTSKGQSEAVISGEKLALKQAGGKVGKYKINYVSLDDSTAQNPGTADEAQTGVRTRARPSRTRRRSSTSASSTREARRSRCRSSTRRTSRRSRPSNTYVGLTTDKPGSEPGEPDKYYPAQKRTYARVVPADDIQAAALVTTMKEDGCKSVHIFNDKTTYGAGLARNIELAAEDAGPQGRGQRRHRPQRPELPLAGGQGQVRLLRRLGRDRRELRPGVQGRGGRQPDRKLYGPDGVAEEAFTDPAKGGIPADVGARTKITVATLGLEEFKKRNNAEAEKFFADYKDDVRHGPAGPVRHLRLRDDVAGPGLAQGRWRQGQRPRGGPRRSCWRTPRTAQSALGMYSIDENGDTTLTDYGLYTIKNGLPTFDKVIKAQGAQLTGRHRTQDEGRVARPAPHAV